MANANAVDTAKTLAQSNIRISDERSRRSGELLLARYRLIERLGAGGFGTVWRAHDEALDRAVAVKRIPLPGEEDRERATREAHATARLAHPAIVSLYEACADEDAFYLISELVEGDTLAQLIAADELTDEDIFDIGLSLCEALEHAHARGVIHRDVKPHNVLVPSEHSRDTPSRSTPATAAKLADFGGARLTGDDALTRTGDVLGTLAYMAPEQSEGHEAGTAADLYSLALVLYEALTGVNPVRGRTPAATARRIGEPIEALACRRRDLSRDLTSAIDDALDPDPARRGTLADLHDALGEALEQGPKRRLLALRPRRATAPHEREVRDRDTPPQPRYSVTEDDLHPVEQLRTEAQRQSKQRDEQAEPEPELARRRTGAALPRTIWIACLLALAAWQAAVDRPGVSLLVLAAGAPLLALPRRSGPGWLAASLAPALGLAGLAGAFPALAAQRSGWLARAALAALGFWWLALAESLLDRRLWLGPPSKLPPRAVWEGSLSSAATHVLAATFTLELLLGAAVWALAAAILPWLVRGHNAALDALLAFAWTLALLAATPLLSGVLFSHDSQPTPRGAVLGAGMGCALAVCARALARAYLTAQNALSAHPRRTCPLEWMLTPAWVGPTTMNPLRTLENMIAGLVEGTFGRVFKTEVRPMELARKLAREMDENTTASVSRVYAPNEYSVWLSPKDRARYEGVEHEVIDELCAYLLEHARGEDLALASRPSIAFHTDERLALGEFGIEARMARIEDDAEQRSEQRQPSAPRALAEPVRGPAWDSARGVREGQAGRPEELEAVGNTMIFSNSERVRKAVERTGARRRSKALLVLAGRRLLVPPRGATIGRSRECDVVLDDSGVSRRHAELRPEGTAWTIEDLGSTNGVRINGIAVRGPHELRSGDRVEMGSTEMLFEIAP